MRGIFFIADTHFGHRNVILFEQEHRPFATIEEHDEHIIANWNSVVKKDDIVYHLGDFCVNRSSLQVARRLNGKIVLIQGNHDTFRTSEYLDVGFSSVRGAVQLDRVILTHIPIHPSQLDERFTHNVHGHLHSKKLDDNRYINVSCEAINLCPLAYETLYR